MDLYNRVLLGNAFAEQSIIRNMNPVKKVLGLLAAVFIFGLNIYVWI